MGGALNEVLLSVNLGMSEFETINAHPTSLAEWRKASRELRSKFVEAAQSYALLLGKHLHHYISQPSSLLHEPAPDPDGVYVESLERASLGVECVDATRNSNEEPPPPGSGGKVRNDAQVAPVGSLGQPEFWWKPCLRFGGLHGRQCGVWGVRVLPAGEAPRTQPQ